MREDAYEGLVGYFSDFSVSLMDVLWWEISIYKGFSPLRTRRNCHSLLCHLVEKSKYESNIQALFFVGKFLNVSFSLPKLFYEGYAKK